MLIDYNSNINSRARSNLVKRIVKISSRIILLFYFVILVSIVYADELP